MLASTTGNIYGIYDLSGGAWEYMAGYYAGEFSFIDMNGGSNGARGFRICLVLQ